MLLLSRVNLQHKFLRQCFFRIIRPIYPLDIYRRRRKRRIYRQGIFHYDGCYVTTCDGSVPVLAAMFTYTNTGSVPLEPSNALFTEEGDTVYKIDTIPEGCIDAGETTNSNFNFVLEPGESVTIVRGIEQKDADEVVTQTFYCDAFYTGDPENLYALKITLDPADADFP